MSPKALRMIQRGVERHGARFDLHWTEHTGGTVDPTTGAVVGGTVRERVMPDLRGHVHEVSATSGFRNMAGIAVGDLVVDLPASVALQGKSGVWLAINGVRYSQKRVSGETRSHLDQLGVAGAALQTLLFSRSE